MNNQKNIENEEKEINNIVYGLLKNNLKIISIKKLPFIIGRNEKSDLVINNPSISKKHALIQFDEEDGENNNMNKDKNIILIDNSLNGTYVNGIKITNGKKILLETGDKISFGNDKIIYIFELMNYDNDKTVIYPHMYGYNKIESNPISLVNEDYYQKSEINHFNGQIQIKDNDNHTNNNKSKEIKAEDNKDNLHKDKQIEKNIKGDQKDSKRGSQKDKSEEKSQNEKNDLNNSAETDTDKNYNNDSKNNSKNKIDNKNNDNKNIDKNNKNNFYNIDQYFSLKQEIFELRKENENLKGEINKLKNSFENTYNNNYKYNTFNNDTLFKKTFNKEINKNNNEISFKNNNTDDSLYNSNINLLAEDLRELGLFRRIKESLIPNYNELDFEELSLKFDNIIIEYKNKYNIAEILLNMENEFNNEITKFNNIISLQQEQKRDTLNKINYLLNKENNFQENNYTKANKYLLEQLNELISDKETNIKIINQLKGNIIKLKTEINLYKANNDKNLEIKNRFKNTNFNSFNYNHNQKNNENIRNNNILNTDYQLQNYIDFNIDKYSIGYNYNRNKNNLNSILDNDIKNEYKKRIKFKN